jgi:hypothetical protein
MDRVWTLGKGHGKRPQSIIRIDEGQGMKVFLTEVLISPTATVLEIQGRRHKPRPGHHDL